MLVTIWWGLDPSCIFASDLQFLKIKERLLKQLVGYLFYLFRLLKHMLHYHPIDTGRKLNVHRRSEDVHDVF